MNAIIGMTELVLNAVDCSAARLPQVIEGSGESLLRLINDILDFAKIEARKLSWCGRSSTFASTWATSHEIAGDPRAGRSLELACRVRPEYPARFAATRTLASGGGEPGWERDQVHRERRGDDGRVAGRRPITKWSCTSPCDTGIGIPAENSTSSLRCSSRWTCRCGGGSAGTGLGLAISSRLVDLMGGHISVESEAGRGARSISRSDSKWPARNRPTPPACGCRSFGARG